MKERTKLPVVLLFGGLLVPAPRWWRAPLAKGHSLCAAVSTGRQAQQQRRRQAAHTSARVVQGKLVLCEQGRLAVLALLPEVESLKLLIHS